MRKLRSELTWREPGLAKKVWNLTWGLVLILGLTAISEIGLRMGYTKSQPEPSQPATTQPIAPALK